MLLISSRHLLVPTRLLLFTSWLGQVRSTQGASFLVLSIYFSYFTCNPWDLGGNDLGRGVHIGSVCFPNPVCTWLFMLVGLVFLWFALVLFSWARLGWSHGLDRSKPFGGLLPCLRTAHGMIFWVLRSGPCGVEVVNDWMVMGVPFGKLKK